MIKSLNEMIYEIHSLIEFGNPDIAEDVLKDYVCTVIDEIMENPSMIYVDDNADEAVYSYIVFENFKRNIK